MPDAGRDRHRPHRPRSRAKVKNDLSRGVAKHTLDAGAIELKTVYYSNMPMAQWTPEANKPLTLSLTADFPEGYKQDIYLAEVDVRMDVTGPDGPLAAPAPIVDQATVSPGYLIKKPNSYGNVFTVPAVPEDAQSVTLTFTYQLLAPSKPKSKTYSKQVTTDTVTVAINGPAPAADATPAAPARRRPRRPRRSASPPLTARPPARRGLRRGRRPRCRWRGSGRGPGSGRRGPSRASATQASS